MTTQFLPVLIIPVLLIGGCQKHNGSDATTDEKFKSPKTLNPKRWKAKAGSESKITFYVRGMSDKLKLT